MSPITYAFFGTGPLAESVLAELFRNGYLPSLIITKPDAEQGRHMLLTEPYIKTWGTLKGIEVFQPESLKDLALDSPLHKKQFDVFIVASYGKIIPDTILNLPTQGVLNVHPSLLPKYRGPSPLESVLLDGAMTTGVSIIKLDSGMDHGPLLSQNAFMISPEATAGTLEVTCGQIGGQMLVQCLPHYLDGSLLPKEQNHSEATICKKITKELGCVLLTDTIDEVRRKFRALTPWPGIYFFIKHKEKEIRVKINAIDLVSSKESSLLTDYIVSVTPEGKKQMDFESFKRGYIRS
ncbi:MAG: methionyl-tRNA formyltransferase [Candidatus Pacebacteria bacterium]|nr:methionyl-tRNA formyltransferase [Candidatus Paceibacterota bacterium]